MGIVLQIPADNLAYSVLRKVLPEPVKIHLPVHRILYLSGEARCCCCFKGVPCASGICTVCVVYAARQECTGR